MLPLGYEISALTTQLLLGMHLQNVIERKKEGKTEKRKERKTEIEQDAFREHIHLNVSDF